MLARGHRLDDLLHAYTMDQFNALFDAAAKNRRREIHEAASALRLGFNADKKGWNRFTREFLGEPSSQAKNTGKMTLEELGKLLKGQKVKKRI